jgi:23S rRNA (adenine2503-C2)-methyltransferase
MASFPQVEGIGTASGANAEQSLFGNTLEQLAVITSSFGFKNYRARQLWHALYKDRFSSVEEITTLPDSIRAQLQTAGWVVGLPPIVQTFTSVDGTERYLIAGSDGSTVETVWMPNGDGAEPGDPSQEAASPSDYRRATICVSSQVGCAVNCQFCLTAKLGIQRNLTAGEIAGQVAAVLNRQKVKVGRDRINLVFMGMGEPFLNYDNFMAAVRLLVDAIGIPESRMTVSTSGILPGIERFARETVRPKLALSLNAPNDEIRERIMPITRKWPIAQLFDALRTIPMGPRQRFTFEYVLLQNVNDRLHHATELAALVRNSGLPVTVNLIAWNPGPDIPYSMPSPEEVSAFQKHLIASGVQTYLRRPRGRDIYAACGQLKRTVA